MILCLMGPTGSGKTALAVELAQHLPCDIISVDSAMVYRGMDIGTAKPNADILRLAPHRLINCVDPVDPYSAGRFCQEALHEITDILSHGRIPLLVGGTMLYFRALIQGLAKMPVRDDKVREEIKKRAANEGWLLLHQELKKIDPVAASRIQVNDSQRIQRALEVYYLTGKTMSEWQLETAPFSQEKFFQLALIPQDRALLHKKISDRFQQMLKQGLIEEVEKLIARGDLHADLPSIRSVGYRQVWAYLQGEMTKDEMCEKAVIATRQLAKRQMTWLRSWPNLTVLEAEAFKNYSCPVEV